MTEMILEDSVNSEDPIALQLKTIIQQGVDNQYLHFEGANQLFTSDQVAQKIADVLNSEPIRKKLLEH
jgi:hypothetical protein